MNQIANLERSAPAAHRRGERWKTFWQAHAQAIRQAEPWNRQRFRRLVDRLLALVTSGDTAGMTAVGDDDLPWERDDVAQAQVLACDTQTNARCLWTPEVPA